MSRLSLFISYFSVKSFDLDLAESQARAFKRQIPLLYTILCVNMIALCYTHLRVAPPFVTVVLPSVFAFVAIIRVWYWLRVKHHTYTAEQAVIYLKTSYYVICALGPTMTAWALALYPYGNGYAKVHVAFFMSITVIGCIFCLMHVRAAALMLTCIVGVPFVIYFLLVGNPVLSAIALNFSLVMLIMVYILFRYYDDFGALIHSEKNLAALNDLNFKMANVDSLTDLPNRRCFFHDLENALAARTGETVLALALIDLDGFKPVNDVLGHAAGDRVLVEVGRRLRAMLGSKTHVARLGGDEFGFFLSVPAGTSELPGAVSAVCEALQRPIVMPNAVAQVAASIGLAFSSPDGTTREELLERADYALYFAKANQRGTPVLFTAEHETIIRRQSRLEQELRKADFETEMALQFQPIVDCSRDKTVAYEALARWRSPVLGMVPPLDFIAAAERTGLINRLTLVLFAKTLDALKSWPDDLQVSFNLSARDVSSMELLEQIAAMVEASGIAPRRIAFEITETALIQDLAQAAERLFILRKLGSCISLDDFGTGYSSLNYIHRIPLDKVKIDRSFVAGLTRDQASRDIVRAIIELCRNLKLICIVEGVETGKQAVILRSLGCTRMQGNYFGEPTSNAEVLRQIEGASAKETYAAGSAAVLPARALA